MQKFGKFGIYNTVRDINGYMIPIFPLTSVKNIGSNFFMSTLNTCKTSLYISSFLGLSFYGMEKDWDFYSAVDLFKKIMPEKQIGNIIQQLKEAIEYQKCSPLTLIELISEEKKQGINNEFCGLS